jgi:type I phosphodiesterase/nucleotide pyrophosphatase
MSFASAVTAAAILCTSPTGGGRRHNVILFVADGLRPVSLNSADAPTLVRLQHEGAWFPNSHALYPTLTTANASALATGHGLGDTGDFANAIYPGYAVFGQGTVTPFIEDDKILAELDAHAGGNFLDATSLLAAARARGFGTAAIGKVGPTLIQDVTQGNANAGVPTTIIIDDRTGTAAGVPLDPRIAAALTSELGGARPPPRHNGKPGTPDDNGYSGSSEKPGTRVANVAQQRFLVDAATKVVLPELRRRGNPFVLVFWSRDPDATQHNQGDSLNGLRPGINGRTSRLGVKNADDTLARLVAFVEADPELAATTDIVVTSDHGFSTLSRRDVAADGRASASPSTRRRLPDVVAGDLPPGFVAIDLAALLGLPLFDPDRPITPAGAHPTYAVVGPDAHPANGNGVIGGTGRIQPRTDAKLIVAANGGSDLIYVLDRRAISVAALAAFLLDQDYVDAVFVDATDGRVPGALSLADINLAGRAVTPRPSIVVAFKTFSGDPQDPLRTQVDVSDSTLQHGQGMHGSFGRADVLNTTIAFGPDFKRGFVDPAPVSNADLPATLARVLGLGMQSRGRLTGRVLSEALIGGPANLSATCGELSSLPDPHGWRSAIHFQAAGGVRYLDAATKTKGKPSWGSWLHEIPCAANH